MGHSHSHDHDANAYYVEQICTIAVCGALGGVTIMLYKQGLLGLILAEKFHIWVLLGGIALLVLVAIRALALWSEAGKAGVHSHDHDHAHDHEQGDCGHEHGNCGHHHEHAHDIAAAPQAAGLPLVHSHHEHGHDHGHDHNHDHDHSHGWAPVRFLPLLIPVVLYFLGLPNEGFSTDRAALDMDTADLKAGGDVGDKGYDPNLGFLELKDAAYDPVRRDFYQGKTVKLKGQFASRGEDTMFSLVRFKISCCAADAVPLNAVILIDDSKLPKDATADQKRITPGQLQGKWVEVRGQVQFRPRKNRDDFITVILVQPTAKEPLSSLIQQVKPDSNPYL